MSAPIRKKIRLRISPCRAASPKAAAGLLKVVAIVRFPGALRLDLAARGLDRRARALGGRDSLERHGLLEFPGQHHLGALGALGYHAGLEKRGQTNNPGP